MAAGVGALPVSTVDRLPRQYLHSRTFSRQWDLTFNASPWTTNVEADLPSAAR